jgi:hypothetical protein
MELCHQSMPRRTGWGGHPGMLRGVPAAATAGGTPTLPSPAKPGRQ